MSSRDDSKSASTGTGSSERPVGRTDEIATLEATVRSEMMRAYWDVVAAKIQPECLDMDLLTRLHGEIRDRLRRWIRPGPRRSAIEERLDTALFRQMLEHGAFGEAELRSLVLYVFDQLALLQSPARDTALELARSTVLAELDRSGSTFSSATTTFLREAHGLLDYLDQDCSAVVRCLHPDRSPTE